MTIQNILSILLLIFLLSGTAILHAEEAPSQEEYAKVVFEEARIYVVYIFDFSLIEPPLGIDNPPENPTDMESDYFQNRIDYGKLNELRTKIQEEISKDSNYDFVYLENSYDRNMIVLIHTKNPDIIKFCYDGLIFWAEIKLKKIEMEKLFRYRNPDLNTLLSEKWEDYGKQMGELLLLLEEQLSTYLPNIPLEDLENGKGGVNGHYIHYIAFLSPSFCIYDESGGQHECFCQLHCEDIACQKAVVELTEKWVGIKGKYAYNNFKYRNLEGKRTYYNNETLIIMGGGELEEYTSQYKNMVLFFNIERNIDEFQRLLKKEYYNYPECYDLFTACKNLADLDKTAAFVSFSKYALNSIEITAESPLLPFYAPDFFEEFRRTREDISVAEDDIDNHISRNEHILIKFSILIAIIIAFVSFLFSIASFCSSRRNQKELNRELSAFQQSFLYETAGMKRELMILKKREDLDSRKRLRTKYRRNL